MIFYSIHWGCEIEVVSQKSRVCDNCDPCWGCDPWPMICRSCTPADKEEICKEYCPDFPIQSNCKSRNCLECIHWKRSSCSRCVNRDISDLDLWFREGEFGCLNREIDCSYCETCKECPPEYSSKQCRELDCLDLDEDCPYWENCEIVCELCQEDGARLSEFCSDCSVCENCDYHIEYQIEWLREDIPPDLRNRIQRIYWDGSCGPEIVSGVFETKEDLIDFFEDLVWCLKQAGWRIDPRRGSGGHLTISLHSTETSDIIPIDDLFFDLLTLVSRFYPVLLLNSCHSLEASRKRGFGWREFPSKERYREKHRAISRKDRYLIEFRYPDGTENPLLFCKVVNLIESMIKYIVSSSLENDIEVDNLFLLDSSLRVFNRIRNSNESKSSIRSSDDYQYLLKTFKKIIKFDEDIF